MQSRCFANLPASSENIHSNPNSQLLHIPAHVLGVCGPSPVLPGRLVEND